MCFLRGDNFRLAILSGSRNTPIGYRMWSIPTISRARRVYTFENTLQIINIRLEIDIKLHDVNISAPASQSERCRGPAVPGPCRASFPMWYYNETERRCQRFIYGGCGGSENRFDSEDDCVENCATTTSRSKFCGFFSQAKHYIAFRVSTFVTNKPSVCPFIYR